MMPERSSFDPSQSLNPYWNRLAIDDFRAFYGRQREREQLAQLIERGQPVSVVGQRRIGKSSLLRSLGFPDLQQWTEGMRIITLDGSYFQASDELGFLGFLLDQLEEELEMPALPVQRESLFKAAEYARRRDVRLVILIDEFDLIAYNEKISGGPLFSFLRALVQEFRIPIVLVSRDGRLEPLLHKSAVGSPFWNIFTSFYLGPLSPEEADLLVRDPAIVSGRPFRDDQVREIAVLGGLHPFFLNIACTYAFNGYEGAALKFEFLREAFPHLDYLRDQLGRSDRQALRDCVVDPRKVDTRIQSDLIRRGLLVPRQNEPPVIFSSAFADLLMADEALPLSSGGLVRETISALGRVFSRAEKS
jgi:hypothetical protein